MDTEKANLITRENLIRFFASRPELKPDAFGVAAGLTTGTMGKLLEKEGSKNSRTLTSHYKEKLLPILERNNYFQFVGSLNTEEN